MTELGRQRSPDTSALAVLAAAGVPRWTRGLLILFAVAVAVFAIMELASLGEQLAYYVIGIHP